MKHKFRRLQITDTQWIGIPNEYARQSWTIGESIFTEWLRRIPTVLYDYTCWTATTTWHHSHQILQTILELWHHRIHSLFIFLYVDGIPFHKFSYHTILEQRPPGTSQWKKNPYSLLCTISVSCPVVGTKSEKEKKQVVFDVLTSHWLHRALYRESPISESVFIECNLQWREVSS